MYIISARHSVYFRFGIKQVGGAVVRGVGGGDTEE